MRLEQVSEVFLSVLPNATFHYMAHAKLDKYIVWAEDGDADNQSMDNKVVLRTLQGTTDYYTKTEYDPVVNQIETAMNKAEMGWQLSSIQYEEETGYIHYEWIWEVELSVG